MFAELFVGRGMGMSITAQILDLTNQKGVREVAAFGQHAQLNAPSSEALRG